jgi:hypothetical protein
MAETHARLAEARTAVEQSCQLLLTPFPHVLDQCSALLAQAVAALSAEDIRPPEPADPAVLEEWRHLQSELRQAGQLLETAASYYNGWDRLLRSKIGGYTASGDAAAISRGGRMALIG